MHFSPPPQCSVECVVGVTLELGEEKGKIYVPQKLAVTPAVLFMIFNSLKSKVLLSSIGMELHLGFIEKTFCQLRERQVKYSNISKL